MRAMGTFEEAYQKAIKENGCNAGETFARSMFRAGAEWMESNRYESKIMCLRDKTKICNLCHDCDVYVLNPDY